MQNTDKKYFSGDDKFLASLIRKRKPNSNKNDYGRILLICGSKKYVGAPYFAAQAAVRSGSGVVYLAIPDAIYTPVASKLSEPVLVPLTSNSTGSISAKSADDISDYLEKCDSCLIGPGMSDNADTAEIVNAVLDKCRVPLIIDADGINAVSKNINILKNAKCPVILTPHEAELNRLLDGAEMPRFTENEKIKTISHFADEYNVILLKKSHKTVVCSNGYPIYINNSGNPGMAKGGSGDILSGIITALCGQKLNPFYAACAAAYIHGLAGDKCAYYFGEYGMTPSEMLKFIPLVFKDIHGC